MFYRLSACCVLLGACTGNAFIDVGAPDTFFIGGDVGVEALPDGCVQPFRFVQPSSPPLPMHPGVAPEVAVLTAVSPVRVELYREARKVEVSVLAGHGSTERLFALLPAQPLQPGAPYLVRVSTEASGVEIDGRRRSLCTTESSLEFVVEEPGPVAGIPGGSWWLAGVESSGMHAAVLHRLLPLMADGYGLALSLQITPRESGADLRLGTISRAPGLPDHEADQLDTLAAIQVGAALVASAAEWQVEDPVNPLVVHNLELSLEPSRTTDELIAIRIAGEFDLSAWPADRLARACAMGEERGIGCVQCSSGKGVEACLRLDARGMVGTVR